MLETRMKHYPEHLGLLFQKNSHGKTACEVTFEKNRKDETFKVIRECIPAQDKHTILHHVNTHAPQYMNDFTMR